MSISAKFQDGEFQVMPAPACHRRSFGWSLVVKCKSQQELVVTCKSQQELVVTCKSQQEMELQNIFVVSGLV